MQHKIIEEVTKKEIDNQAQIAQKMVDLHVQAINDNRHYVFREFNEGMAAQREWNLQQFGIIKDKIGDICQAQIASQQKVKQDILEHNKLHEQ